MANDDDFLPELGRSRATRGKRGAKYLHRVLRAANLARGGAAAPARRAGFDGSRIGRGSAVGRILASRGRAAAFARRRVIIKSRIVRLAGKGAAGARAHLRYLQRDGVTREGAPGRLYDRASDRAEGGAFLERGNGDRHQFRFIVSAEDGTDYDDLKPLTRRLMARMEEDLGTRLDWVAVDHFNTGHPHTHILLRGKDDRGRDLIIARDYLTRGMRERAAELVDLDLGPRSPQAVRDTIRADIEQERFTGIDRALLRDADAEGHVAAVGRDAFDQTIRIGRLRKLERLGLAEPAAPGHWRLAPGLRDTLVRMGERGDIIRTMQRAFAERGMAPAPADRMIYDPAAPGARPLVGRLLERGLADELDDRHYLLVEATDGRTHYVDIGRGENLDALREGAILRVTPRDARPRDADRTVAEVAAAHGGRYSVDTHLRHDPSATEAFAETHVRRLEAIRRATGGVTREPDGSWVIAPDHLERAAAHEAARVRDRPVAVETLSPLPLEQLAGHDGATWLDRELVAADPEPLRDAGFGQAVRAAQAQRRQWLVAQGFAEEGDGGVRLRAGLIEALRRRELARVGAQLARELGMRFVETPAGGRIDGIYRRAVDTADGRLALIEKSREFTLVPWRPVLERQLGKSVSGVLRGDAISWTIGRGRGPEIG